MKYSRWQGTACAKGLEVACAWGMKSQHAEFSKEEREE